MAYNNIDDAFLGRMADLQFPPMPVEEPAQESITLAAGPTGTMSDAGRGMPSIKPLPQTTLERALEQTGLTLEQAGRFLDSLGQVDIPMLGKVSLADLVPFVGTAKEGTRSVMAPAEWQGTPKMLQQMGTGVGSMVDRVTTGTGMARQLRPDAQLAAMDVAFNAVPVAKVATKGAKAAGKALAPKAGEMLSDYMRRSGMQLDLIGYHGSPHRFAPEEGAPMGRFRSDRIGSGEGNQSFGYGLYFAENPKVADDYRFVEREWFDTSKATYNNKTIDQHYDQAQRDQERAFRTKNPALEKDANARLAFWESVMTHTHPEQVIKNAVEDFEGWPEFGAYAKSIDLNKFRGIPKPGYMYTVDIPDEMVGKLLDWDGPLGQQSPEIQALAKQYNLSMDDLGGDLLAAAGGKTPKGAQIMREAGIPGVRYFDKGSRDLGQGTRNIVVFPGGEDQIKIIKTEGAK